MILSMAMSMCLMMGCIDLSLGNCLHERRRDGAVPEQRGERSGLHSGRSHLRNVVQFLNGFVVTKMKVPPFIATFGASGIAQSVANTLSNKRTISWESAPNNRLVDLLGSNVLTVIFGPKPSQILSISVLLLITLLVIACVLLVFKKTTLGSNIYALGANEETARLSGINTVRWKVGVYMLSGFLAAVAGMVVMIRTNSLQPTVGDGLEFQAVVAAVLGGNSMKGERAPYRGRCLGR